MESSGEAVVSEVRFRRSPQTPFEAEMLTALEGKGIGNIRIILEPGKSCSCGSRQAEFRGDFSLQGQEKEIPVVIYTCPECRWVGWKCPKGAGHVGGIFFSSTSFEKAPKRVLWDLW